MKKFPVIAQLMSSFQRLKGASETEVLQVTAPALEDGAHHVFLTVQKQRELELLCGQLFRRKDLLITGRLQFLGFEDIKKRMGTRWPALSQLVHMNVTNIIRQYLEKGDILIPYQDDMYVLIFAHADLEEGQVKAKLMCQKIQEGLFALEDGVLSGIEIRCALNEMNTANLVNKNLQEVMDIILPDAPWDKRVKAGKDSADILAFPMADVSAKEYLETSVRKTEFVLPDMNCAYLPLWDVKRGALTTYVCLARGHSQEKNLINAHNALFSTQPALVRASYDLAILGVVTRELASMALQQRRLFIVCPVQHDTLHGFDTYDEYKTALMNIPPAHRQFLILLVMNLNEAIPPKEMFWFMPALKGVARQIFAEVPLRKDADFNFLIQAGFKAVGVAIEAHAASERDVLKLLQTFAARARNFKVPNVFFLNTRSLSLTTSTVCSGFSFLGGSAIHGEVLRPDIVHKFKHEDLLSGLSGVT